MCPGPEHTLDCIQGLIDLYTAWNAAEPGKGYDAKAAEWKAKLELATQQQTKNEATTPATTDKK